MLLWVISVLLLNSSEVYPSARFTLDIGHKSRRSAASLQNSLLSFPQTTHVGIASSIAVDLSANLAQNNSLPVLTKIIRRVGHFRLLGPNVWWEISQFWIEYIKPIGQMSGEPWKFFDNTALPAVCWQTAYRESQQLLLRGIYVLFIVIRMPFLGLHWILLICTSQLLYLSLFIPSATLLKSDQPTFSVLCGFKS